MEVTNSLNKFKKYFKNMSRIDILGVIIFLIVEFLVIGMISKEFFSLYSIHNLLINISPIGIVAIGMTFVLISGGIDLSVGSTFGLGGMVLAILVSRIGIFTPLAFMLTLITGAIIGYTIGLLVTKLKINSIITTLAFISILRGLVYILGGGQAQLVTVNDEFIFWLGQGEIFTIPVQFIIFIFLAILGILFLKFTSTGRYIIAVGDNERAARLTGINVTNVRILVFIITGVLATFAGIINLSRLNAADTSAGVGFEIEVISAVIIGGTALSGGRGTVFGSVIGATIITVLTTGLIFIGVSQTGYYVGLGAIIIGAVLLDRIRKRLKE